MKQWILALLAFFYLAGGDLSAGTVSGTVTNSTTGTALSGVSIQAQLLGIPVGTATTNSSGAYSIPSLGVGTYTIVATKSGFVVATTPNIIVTLTSTNPCNFQLIPLGSISGTITNNAGGAPLASATVQMIQSGSVIASTTTNSSGAYSITGLAPGSYTLSVSTTHFQDNTAAVAILAGANSSTNLSLTPNTGSVSGAITSSASLLGLPGASITFSQNGTTIATTTSGLLGAYSISSLAPGTYSVSVNLAGYQTLTTSVTIISDNTTTLNNNLSLLNGILSGTVTDASSDGNLSGATVTVLQGSTLIASTTTASNGTYTVPNLAPGSYTVTIAFTNYLTGSLSAAIITNQTTTLNPALQPIPGSIAGIITNSQTSLNLAGATVGIYTGTTLIASTTTNSSGAFSISGLAVGNYTLTVSLANFVSLSQSVTITSNATLTKNCALTPQLGIVTGIVQDLNSLTLLGGATVQLLQGSTVVATTTTTLAGLYSFSVLPGTYTIAVSNPTYVSATASVSVLSNLTVTANITLTSNPGTASGTITDSITTSALSNATVQILNGSTVLASTTTNASGAYTITSLLPGTYTLSISQTNYTPATRIIIIVANQTTTTNVSLQPQSGTANGQVKNSITSSILQGASVAFYQGSSLVASTITDSAGNYSVATLIPGSYVLTVTALNYQTAQQSITIQSNQTTTTNINLTPQPGSLSGIVTNAVNSALLQGSTVSLSQGGAVVATTTTNNLGSYTFSNLQPGIYTATTSFTNFTASTQSVTISSNSAATANFSLQPQTGILSGTITNSLTTLNLTNVTVNALQGSTIVATTTTNASGAFSFNLVPGSYTIAGILSNYQTTSQTATIQSNVTTTLNFTLTPVPGIAAGSIISAATSLPLTGVNVAVLQGSATISSGQTNALGFYSISNLTPGNYTIQFSLSNYQTISQPLVISSNTTTTVNGALQLQPGTISGTISNALTNSPLAGATVSALQGSTTIATTTTGSNGSYTFSSLPAGIYTITATGTNFQTASALLVTVLPNQTTTTNLNLQPIPGIVSGTITDISSNPISGATVSIAQNGITIATTVTLSNGTYSISNLVPGNYTLVAGALNFQSVSQNITISSNTTTPVSLSLASSPGAIAGIVTSTSLNPLSGATVQVLQGNTILGTTTTAADGSYSITGLTPNPSGVYTFRATATSFQTLTTTAAISSNITTPVNFSLAPLPGSITGTITNSQTSASVSGATIQVSQGLILIGSTTTDTNGLYTISGLAPGSYTVSGMATNFQSGSANASVSSNATTTSNLSLTPSSGTLSGVITDSITTNPLSGALVTVRNQGLFVASALTLVDGSFSISNLTPGSYTVVISDTNYQNSSLSVTIFSNQTTTANAALQSLPGYISGNIAHLTTVISGATITITQGAQTIATVTSDSSGNYTTPGLAPGSYTVTVGASTYTQATLGALVVANITTNVNFNLNLQPGTITGILTDAITSAPLSNALITILSGNVTVATTLSASDGSYSCQGLSAGSYLVVATSLQYQTFAQSCTVQPNLTTTVNLALQLDPGSLSGQIVDAITLNSLTGASITVSSGNVTTATALTDSNGYYTLTGLTPGSYTVNIQSINYKNTVLGCLILANATTTLNAALIGNPSTISGQVFDNASNPLPGSNINVYTGSLLIASQVADSNGQFAFNNLAEGSYSVVASNANFQSISQSVTLTVGSTKTITFNLLPNPGNCVCTLLDLINLQPLSGANVAILQGSLTIASSITSSLGTCDFSGLTPGAYIVIATNANYQIAVQSITIQANITSNVSFELQRLPISLTGIISDLNTGLPLASATVNVISNGIIIATAITDTNGNYLVASLAPGSYSVKVSALNYQTSLQLFEALGNSTLNVGLQANSGNISISITDAITTNPILGASVVIYNPLSNVALATAVTDATGICLIDGIAPGIYNAIITDTNYQNSTLSVVVIANITASLNINLLPNPGSISCIIEDALSLLPISGCLVEALQGTVVIASSITDSLGSCNFLGLTPGSYSVRATIANYQIATQTAIVLPNVQTSLQLNLSLNPGALTGNIFDLLTSLILPQAQVSLFSGQTLIATTLSDALGNYAFTSIAPGSYTLRVTLLNFETLTATVTITANSTSHHDCGMHSKPGNIIGTVLDAVTSNPISGASITISNGSTIIANVQTDNSGNYSISGLSANVNYSVNCSATNYQGANLGVTVQANQTKTVNFNLNSNPGMIVGQITDSMTSAGIANATVNLIQGSLTVATTMTDSSGNYQLISLASGNYTLNVNASLYQTATLSTQVQAAQTTTLNVSLSLNPGSLQGTVTDATTSLAIANAQIQLFKGSVLIGSATTTSNGVYTILGLAPGNYTISVNALAYQTASNSITILANQTTTSNFNLQTNPGSIIGQVTAISGGSAIIGASVALYQNSNLMGSVITDNNGSYLLANLAPGQYTIVASANNFQNSSLGVTVVANQSTSANFSLGSQPGSIAGTVFGASASIDLLQGSSTISSTVTGANGSYQFNNLAAGSYTLRFQAANFQTVVLSAIVLANTTTILNVTLQSQVGTIVGQVIDATTLSPLNNVTLDILQNSSIVETVQTNNLGNYSFSGLATGSYVVRATLNNYQIVSIGANVQVNVTTTVNFSLNQLTGVLTGQLADSATGLLLADANVDLFLGSNLIASTVTDSNGNYTISNLTPGSYTVRASLTNYQTSIQSGFIVANSITTVNFQLAANPGSIVGQITDALTSNGISAASVTVYLSQGNIALQSAISDSNGNYVINGLPAGNYSLQFSAPQYQTVVLGVTVFASTQTLANVALQSQPGTIMGQVTDSITLGAISGATVTIMQGQSTFATGVTDNNGNYTISGLAHGTYTVLISAPNYQTISNSAIIQINSTLTLNFSLQGQPGSLEGTITDSSGNPISGALTVLQNGTVLIGTVASDATGHYMMTGLAPGLYTISVSATNFSTVLSSVTIRSNATTVASFTLTAQPGTSVGQVLDAITTNPIAGATVVVLQNSTIVATSLTDSNGNYVINGLGVGSYTIRVTVANYQTISQGLTILANQTTTINFNLQSQPGNATGVVVDAATLSPLGNVNVNAYQGSNLITSVLTDNSGTYNLADLAPGSYTLIFSATNYQSFSEGIIVQANVTTVADVSLASNPGNVSGIVTDLLSQPITGATVQVYSGSQQIGFTLTDSNGAYTILGLAPGTYNLNVNAPNYQSSSSIFSIVPSQAVSLNLTLAADPGMLSGTVTDSVTLSPIVGATISVQQGSLSIANAITDSNGLWTVANLARGSYTVIVSSPLYQTSSVGATVQINSTTSVNTSLVANPGSVVGQVVSGSTPIAGATIEILQGNSTVATTLTDSSGNFLINSLAPGSYIIRASATTYNTATMGLNIIAGSQVVANLTLAANPGSLIGNVTDTNSIPLGGISISLLRGNTGIASTLTDVNGNYQISSLSAGSYTLVTASSLYETVTIGVSVTANQTTTVNLSLLNNPGSIAGQITDMSTALSLSGASIAVLNGNTIVANVLSDSNGNFVVNGLSAGSYTVKALLNGYQLSVQSAIVVGGSTTTVNLALLSNPGIVTGTVTNQSSMPITGGSVALHVIQGNIIIATTMTDGNGVYVIDNLGSGSYTISVMAANYQSAIQTFSVNEASTTIVNFMLNLNPGSLTGVIQDSTSVIAGATVQLLSGSTLLTSMLTDSTGAYQISNLAPGQYTLEISAANHQTLVLTVTIVSGITTTANATLQTNPGSIAGLVIDASNNQTISGLLINVSQNSTVVATAYTDANGNFQILNLAPGNYTVTVLGTNYQTAVLNTTVAANTTTTLNLFLQSQPGTISGIITDEASNPIQNALIQALQGSIVVANGSSDSQGNYQLIGLQAGFYTLRVSAASYQTVVQGATVTLGSVSTINFILASSPGNVSGVIKDATTHNPIAGTTITVIQGNVPVASVLSQSNGQFSIVGLAVGNYTIQAEATGYQLSQQGITITPNATLTVNFNLNAGVASIQGQVIDQNTTNPIVGATISIYSGNSFVTTVKTDTNGNYFISNLFPGQFTINAAANNYVTATASTTVEALMTDIVNFGLTASPGSITGTVINQMSLPVAGATVTITQNSQIVTSTLTDANGNYTIPGLAPASYTVTVNATAYATLSQGATVTSNATTNISFTLTNITGSATVHVVDINNISLAGATVEILQNQALIASLLTDTQGSLTYSELAPGSYIFRVSLNGYQTVIQSTTIVSLQTNALVFVLAQDPGTLTGIIEDGSSNTLANASIQVVQGTTVIASTTSGSNGQFTLPNLAPGSYNIRVSLQTFETYIAGVTIISNQTTVVTIILLNNPGIVSGQITDAITGLGLAGALVDLFQNSTLVASQLTDSNGNYTIGNLAPGSYTLQVNLSNYQTATIAFTAVANVTTIVNGALTGEPGTITGIVTDSSTSFGLANATVNVLNGSQIIAYTLTDSNGNYTVPNLAPGTYQVNVQANGYQTVTSGSSVLANNSSVVNFNLVGLVGTANGTVTGLSSLPLAGSQVSIYQGSTLIASTLTDSNGNYTISNLSPGTYTLVVIAANYQTSSSTITIQANVSTTLDVVLNSNPGSITGQITDAINAITINGATVQVSIGQTVIGSSFSDSNGNFTINNLSPGYYIVTISSLGYQTLTESITLSVGQILTLNTSLQSNPGSISGVVSNSASLALPGATVRLIQGTTLVSSTLTDSTGNYSFNGVAPGSYDIQAVAPLYQLSNCFANVTAGVASVMNFTLQANPGSVQGSVSDGIQLLPNVTITITSGSTIIATTQTNALGLYTLSNLSPGNYTLQASLSSYQTLTQGLQIMSGSVASVNLVLQSLPSTIYGTISSSLTPILGASVSCYSNNTLISSILTDASGNYTINGLSAGNYSLNVTATGYQTAVSGVQVPPNSSVLVNFNLSSSFGSIIGTLVNSSALPIVGATITVTQNNVVVTSTTSLGDGSYVLNGIGAGSYTISVSASTYQTNNQGISVIAGQSIALNFILQSQPNTLAGLILDNSSQAIVGAQISLFQNGSLVANTLSNSEGSYQITGISNGSFNLIVNASLFQTANAGMSFTGGQLLTRNFILSSNIGNIQGIVTDISSNPLANATVSISQNSIVLATVLTDGNGLYMVNNLAAGNYEIVCSLNNYQTSLQGAIVIAGNMTTVNFALSTNFGTLEGIISDNNAGTPITGATINVISQNVVIATATTDNNGSYQINGLGNGTYTVTILSSNYQTAYQSAVIQTGMTTTASVSLFANPGSIQGSVTSLNIPVINANVSISLLQGNTVISSSLTDSNGNYLISGIAPGSYLIKVNATGYQIQAQGVIVNAGQTASANFSLESNPGVLSGSASVGGAEVQLLQGNVVIASAIADANGNFMIPNLPSGSFTLSIQAPNYQTNASSVQIIAGEVSSVTITLMPNPGIISGTITDSNSLQPINGASVNVLQGLNLIGSTLTDANGNYSFNGVVSGSYTLQVSAANYQTVTQGAIVEAPLTTIANIALTGQPSSITGTIIDSTTNLALSGAQVNIIQNNQLIQNRVTDSNGNFTVLGLASGSYSIQTSINQYQTNVTGVVLQQNQTTNVVIALQSNPGSIVGTVTNNLSQPIVGASISLDILQGNLLVATSLTDPSGNYTIPNLQPGSYVIKAAAQGYETATQGVIVIANTQVTVSFMLQSNPGSINGTILDANTMTGIAGISVTIFQGPLLIASTTTDTNGNYTVSGLPAGTYTVNVSGTSYQSTNTNVSVQSGNTTTATILLQNNPGTFLGIITDSNGNPISGATINLANNGVSFGSTVTGNDGSYQINGVAAGNYIITISAPGFQTVNLGATIQSGQTVTQNSSLQANPGELFGNIVDATTELPIPNATIRLLQNNILVTTTITDSSGNYQIQNLAPGSFQVQLNATNYQSINVNVNIISNQTTTLNSSLNENPGEITGTVTDTSSLPLAGVSIQLFQNFMAIGTDTTDSTGNYSISGLAPGDYSVIAGGNSYGLVTQDATVIANETTIIDFVIDVQIGSISGFVTAAGSGNPLSSVSISLFSGTSLLVNSLTDANGLYSLNALPAGSYTIRFSSPNYQIDVETTVVVDGENSEVDVILDPLPGTLTGTVTNALTGSPLNGVAITLFGGELPIATTMTDSSGNYSVNTLPPGTYTVQFSLPTYQTVVGDPTIVSDEVTTLNVALDPIPNAPTHARQCLLKNTFVTQTEYANRLTWQASVSVDVVGYRIYRNGKVIAEVAATVTSYEDHNVSKKRHYLYQISSVNTLGVESALTDFARGKKCPCPCTCR